MARIISIHSFRGGTGKSNTTANLAALLAADGLRVGVIDTDIQSPGIHVLFGFGEDHIRHTLNDYLWGRCDITATAHDVTAHLKGDISGQIFLIPSSIRAGEITRVLRDGYDVSRLNDGIRQLVRALQLDILLIDTHPGLNEETLLAIAISHALVIILRPDQQDYQGTGVTIEVARQLDVPRLLLVVNKVPAPLNLADVKARVETTYNAEVAAILPHSDELMLLASASIFALQYPEHPVTAAYQQLAAKLTEE
jgi:MinD-like ATPase involved in chromosome partitioning or flagellar assembly